MAGSATDNAMELFSWRRLNAVVAQEDPAKPPSRENQRRGVAGVHGREGRGASVWRVPVGRGGNRLHLPPRPSPRHPVPHRTTHSVGQLSHRGRASLLFGDEFTCDDRSAAMGLTLLKTRDAATGVESHRMVGGVAMLM